MRIAYIAHLRTSRETGVLKKILGQMSTWAAQGHEAKLFVLTPEPVWAGMSGVQTETVLAGSLARRFLDASMLANRVAAWTPSMVYFRDMEWYPAWNRMMKKTPTVIEVNSNDAAERAQLARSGLSVLKDSYHAITRNLLFKHARGIVCVTQELTNMLARYGLPTAAIGNGIDLKSYEVKAPPSNPEPHLVFVGSPGQPWHGIDLLLTLARHRPGWAFDVVGYSSSDMNAGIPQNVRMHGYLGRESYQLIMDQADIGIGSLALYRNDMYEGSSLKVREYLAQGIPIIIGCRDTDFPGEEPFIFVLPGPHAGILESLQQVDAFVQEWMGKRVARSHVVHLDTSEKERKRLSFLEQVLHSVD